MYNLINVSLINEQIPISPKYDIQSKKCKKSPLSALYLNQNTLSGDFIVLYSILLLD